MMMAMVMMDEPHCPWVIYNNDLYGAVQCSWQGIDLHISAGIFYSAIPRTISKTIALEYFTYPAYQILKNNFLGYTVIQLA